MVRSEAWALGTWHACVLMWLVVAVLHFVGGTSVFDGLSSWIGLAAFAWLWLLAVWSADRTLHYPTRGAAAAAFGAVSASAFIIGIQATVLVIALASGESLAWGEYVFLVIFAGFALLPGAIIGLLFLGLDNLILGDLIPVEGEPVGMPPLP